MSEAQHRAPRGRVATRGARSGNSFGSRGGFRGSRVNGDSNASSSEDQGEVGQLKKQYADELAKVKEVVPNWSDDDIVSALKDFQGDVVLTINRLTEGSYAQWDEVKKKTNRSRSKVPDSAPETPTIGARSSRGRGSQDAPRGSRGGRATERGGRAPRGRGGAAINGQRANGPEDWGKKDSQDDNIAEDAPEAIAKSDVDHANTATQKPPLHLLIRPKRASPPPPQQQPSPPPPPPTPPPPPPPSAPKSAPEEPASPPKQEESEEPEPTPTESLPPPPQPTEPATPIAPEVEEEPAEPELEPEPEPPVIEVEESTRAPEVPEIPEIKTEEPPVESAQQPLTEQNLEKVEDIAPPAPTGTQASTVNSTAPPTRSSTAATPTAPAPPTPQTRYAGLSTPKIGSARTASFTRRTLDQQEAVVMPGNHAIDRTIVQFGSLGLNGAAIDDEDYDVEPTREKPETATQLPEQSPPPHPTATLPPAAPPVQTPQVAPAQTSVQPIVQQTVQPQAQTQLQPQVQPQVQPQIQTQVQPPQPQPQQPPPATVQDALPTPRQAPGLPAQPQVQAQVHQQASPQPPLAPQTMASQQHMNPQLSNQFNRFGGIEQTQPAQKPYDSFQQHIPQQHTPQTQAAQLPQTQQAQQQTYGYPTHHQQHHQQSHPAQAGIAALSNLPDQYNNYYNSDLQRAGAPGFNYYTNPYSQPAQDTTGSIPRVASGMGTAAGDTPSQLPTAPSQTASRFGQVGEQTSGHATPSPGIPALPTSQAPNPQQTAAHQQYQMQPYYHPGYYYMNQVFNYDSPYSGSNELSEGFSSYQQFYPSYQTPFGKQQGLYTQPHQSFMSQYSDHTTTPAGLGGFGAPSNQGRDGTTGVGDYSRAAASQAQQSHPQNASANFGGLPNFLNSRGLPEQQQLGSGVGQQQGTQQGQSDDNLKPFGDTKPPTGPASGATLQGQPRPGSATSGAANLPQQVAQPQGGMGYPHNLNHHLHGHQAQQPSQHTVAQGHGYGQYLYGQYPSQYQGNNSRQGGNAWGYGGH
ncbi:hypothetical protein BDZ91DRAFT_826309 [Kalaharituber pfeilii]|nr:hypothetical protein BDZ91DRAFT_826309 [Kalaharituber pfeilii]